VSFQSTVGRSTHPPTEVLATPARQVLNGARRLGRRPSATTYVMSAVVRPRLSPCASRTAARPASPSRDSVHYGTFRNRNPSATPDLVFWKTRRLVSSAGRLHHGGPLTVGARVRVREPRGCYVTGVRPPMRRWRHPIIGVWLTRKAGVPFRLPANAVDHWVRARYNV